MAFQRKNKQMSSLFTTKTVLQLLEANYRTAAAERNEILPDDFDMKTLVLQVLTDTGLVEQRSSKLAITDFLKLLTAFNEKGVHFA